MSVSPSWFLGLGPLMGGKSACLNTLFPNFMKGSPRILEVSELPPPRHT